MIFKFPPKLSKSIKKIISVVDEKSILFRHFRGYHIVHKLHQDIHIVKLYVRFDINLDGFVRECLTNTIKMHKYIIKVISKVSTEISFFEVSTRKRSQSGAASKFKLIRYPSMLAQQFLLPETCRLVLFDSKLPSYSSPAFLLPATTHPG